MKPSDFFNQPLIPLQRQYEALRAFYVDRLSADAVALQFKLSPAYFKKLRLLFMQALKDSRNPFFTALKTGPKQRFTHSEVIDQIIVLRKKNHAITDIQTILRAQEMNISLDTIDAILKDEGFAPLPKRTRRERAATLVPAKISAPESVALKVTDQLFTTEQNAAPLIFLPLIEKLGIIDAIQRAGYPHTSVLSEVSSVMSFLVLKLLGQERLSFDTDWNLDRALGFCAGLNVLPKKSTLSSYSYRVERSSNRSLLGELSRIFQDTAEEGEFNLDFKAIPHWGEASVLEKNWSGTRGKRIKSLLSLIVQDPATGLLSFTDADIRHRRQAEAVVEFVDFWKEGRGVAPKMLIFDSTFTTYKNLNQLNQSPDNIKFLTLRHRGRNLVQGVAKIPEKEWQRIQLEGKGRKKQTVLVHDGVTKLKDYQGEVRQVIMTEHGREKPAFLITNDFAMDVKTVVRKYARRWLVEKEIAEQIQFFHLNNPSSSIVVKVDFDLTLSLLAHNLYRELTKQLPGFERCNVSTICRKFLENGASVKIEGKEVTVFLKKKTHLPILFQLPWMHEKTKLSWLDLTINFKAATTS